MAKVKGNPKNGPKKVCSMTRMLLLLACAVLSLQGYIVSRGTSSPKEKATSTDYLAKIYEPDDVPTDYADGEPAFSEEDTRKQKASFDRANAEAKRIKSKIAKEYESKTRELEKAVKQRERQDAEKDAFEKLKRMMERDDHRHEALEKRQMPEEDKREARYRMRDEFEQRKRQILGGPREQKHRMRDELEQRKRDTKELRNVRGNRKTRDAFKRPEPNMGRRRQRIPEREAVDPRRSQRIPEREAVDPRKQEEERQIIMKEKLRQKEIERKRQSQANEAFEERQRAMAEDRKRREREAVEKRKAQRERDEKRIAKRRHEEELRKQEQQKKKTTKRKSRFDLPLRPHPKLMTLCHENYAFQPCRTLRSVVVNIIFVRAPMHNRETKLYEK